MILLFDRKMLRNFRKDGHSWKKKKDGKTVKEAHEHLKVRGFFLTIFEGLYLVFTFTSVYVKSKYGCNVFVKFQDHLNISIYFSNFDL